jgi:hypothetical protein
MMPQQYEIIFPPFQDGTFEKVREAYHLQEIVKLQQKIDHQNHVIAGYRSIEEQRKKAKLNENTTHTKRDH